MSKKILPICENPLLVASVDYAHILSIVLNKPNAYEWFAENYIQILVNKDGLDTVPMFYNFIDYQTLYNTEYYFVAKNKACPFLDIYRRDYKEYQEFNISIIDYLKAKIDNNYYIFLYLDINLISAYKIKGSYHCPLLFGYDDDKEIFFFRDYCNYHYSTNTASYTEIEKAFKSFISQDIKFKEHIKYGINCIKLIDCDYRLNVKRLKSVLQDYLDGDNVKESYMKFIYNDDYHYGIKVIELTIAAIERNIETNYFELGRPIRFSHFIDHKVAMKIRLEILKEKDYISFENFEKLFSDVQDAIKISYIIQNLYIKFYINKDKRIISRIIILLEQLKSLDIKYIGELIKLL